MHGFLLVDKERGSTSFSCVSAVRKICDTRRVGFAGTLDPLASGLMILAVGEVTKLLGYLEAMDKVYEVVVRFGATSNTYDAEGEIVGVEGGEEPARAVLEQVLRDAFLGERDQVPPAFSALKVAGRRSYDRARKGEKVELKPRRVNFFSLDLLSFEWPQATIRVHCSKGTYIRSFAHDLGQTLGCGGYVDELRRLKIGKHSIDDAVLLENLTAANVDSHFISPQKLLAELPQLSLSDADAQILANGGFINIPSSLQIESDDKPILGIHHDVCVGVLEFHGGKLKIKRKLNIV